MSDNAPPPYQEPPAYGTTPTYPAAPAHPAQGYPAAPGYPSAPGAYAPAGGTTNTLAIVSLIASIAGFVIIPLIASIVGVITGHMALGQIAKTGEQGRGLALAGTIIGWVGIAFSVLAVVAVLLFLPAFLTLIVNT